MTGSNIVTNGRIAFNSQPAKDFEIGKTLVYDTSHTIDLENVPLDGGILVKLIVVSPDPGQRISFIEESEATKGSMIPPFKKGDPIRTFAVGVVLRSENPAAVPGDYVHTYATLQNYVIIKDLSFTYVLEEGNQGLPWTAYVGAAGMPGQTAWMGWQEYARAKKGETAFVSAAAGPVGSFVVQLAKRDGLKVIASAGSQAKLDWLKNQLGADVVFNYKTTDTAEVLKREGGIDIYWDNVGGETLDAALKEAKFGARIIACGMTSGYNGGIVPTKNLIEIIVKVITIQGMLVTTLYPKHLKDFYATVPKLIANGEIKYKETVYKGKGLGSFEEAFVALFEGVGLGKVVVSLEDDA